MADQVLGFCGNACGYSPGASFRCGWCERDVCWCSGCDDEFERELGPICDECAAKHVCVQADADPDRDRCEPCCVRSARQEREHEAKQLAAWADDFAPLFGEATTNG